MKHRLKSQYVDYLTIMTIKYVNPEKSSLNSLLFEILSYLYASIQKPRYGQ